MVYQRHVFPHMHAAVQFFIEQGIWQLPDITFSGDFGQSEENQAGFGTVDEIGPVFLIHADGRVEVTVSDEWLAAQSAMEALRLEADAQRALQEG